MRKRNLHNGTQQINTASITTMRTNQTIINYERNFQTYRATGAQSKINAHENAQSTMQDFQQNNDRNLDFLTFVSQHGI